MASPPSMNLHLDWEGGLRFSGNVGETPVQVDGDAEAAPSPVKMLAASLAACMAIDVVHILGKMRTPALSLGVDSRIQRADNDPRRVVQVTMIFKVGGDVPAGNVQRALDLSRETYCSVWSSLRQDIELKTTFEVVPA
ncbi:MAG TPA: OsmC family protein [Acidobacteriota bacterium]